MQMGSHLDSIFLILIFSVLLEGCDQTETNPIYYQGQEIKEPTPFYPNAVQTVNGINFSRDGQQLFTSQQVEKQFDNGRNYASIVVSELNNEKKWISTTLDFGIDAYHPVLSIDNESLFFNSRSHPDSGNSSIPHNIWVVQKANERWGQPYMLKQVNSPFYDSYPSTTRSKNLYFNSDRPGGKGGMDFYVVRFIEGKYQDPINLEELNSGDIENDLVVDTDERFIIFNRYFPETGGLDMFLSIRIDGQWKAPRILDNINSPDKYELTPALSPDGKYFFFELDNRIMQIDLTSLFTDEEKVILGM